MAIFFKSVSTSFESLTLYSEKKYEILPLNEKQILNLLSKRRIYRSLFSCQLTIIPFLHIFFFLPKLFIYFHSKYHIFDLLIWYENIFCFWNDLFYCHRVWESFTSFMSDFRNRWFNITNVKPSIINDFFPWNIASQLCANVKYFYSWRGSTDWTQLYEDFVLQKYLFWFPFLLENLGSFTSPNTDLAQT